MMSSEGPTDVQNEVKDISEEVISVFKAPTIQLKFKSKRPAQSNSLESAEQEKLIHTAQKPSEPNTDSIPKESENKQPHITRKSPANQLKEKNVPIPYKEPAWARIPEEPYKFEVIKNGCIMDNVDLTSKSFHVFGRLANCDVIMEHPSISRHHAVVQFRGTVQNDLSQDGGEIETSQDGGERVTSQDGGKDANTSQDGRKDANASQDGVKTDMTSQPDPGFYLFDLGSTHGTTINKCPVKAKVYTRLRVGHVLKFGGSSRFYVLQGPEEDQDEESEFTVTELKDMRNREIIHQKMLIEKQKLMEEEEELAKLKLKVKHEESGIDWGMKEDAVEDGLQINPFALPQPENEELYVDDPKKTLRGWFEREGFNLDYQVEERGIGQFFCKIDLPVDNEATGQPLVAEALVKGKKKEAVVQCALEACRILDLQGLLRQARHESRKRKSRNWQEDDYYDSDEDTFLDRTGTIEKKRQVRMSKDDRTGKTADTYDTLVEKRAVLEKEIGDMESRLSKEDAQEAKRKQEAVDDDDLDAYMSRLDSTTGVSDSKTRTIRNSELQEKRRELSRMDRLIKLVKPVNYTPKATLAFTGKMKGFHKPKTKPVPTDKQKIVVEQTVVLGDIEKDVEKEVEKSPSVSTDRTEARSAPDLKDSKEGGQSQATEEPTPESLSLPVVPDINRVESESDGLQVATGVAISRETVENNKSLEKRSKGRTNLIAAEAPPAKVSKKYTVDPFDVDYAMWVPPTDQAGDGKTKLNDKYGY